MLRTLVLTIALVSAVGTVVLAQIPPQPPPVASPLGQGSEQERAACHPDVMRFCKQIMQDSGDDPLTILGCLQSYRPRISNACQQVLAGHGV